jgi:hypothetical protein
VYNEHEKKFGWGQTSPERLSATWTNVAEAQELDKKWDAKQAFDTRFLPAK